MAYDYHIMTHTLLDREDVTAQSVRMKTITKFLHLAFTDLTLPIAAVTASGDQNDQNQASTIYKFTPGGVQSTFGSVPGQGFGLAFDGEGNLFTSVNYAVDPSEIWKFAPDGTSSVFVTATDVISGWGDLAFDRFGNLFTPTDSAPPTPDKILKFTPDGEESDFATGFTEPRGVAFNRGGKLFVTKRAL